MWVDGYSFREATLSMLFFPQCLLKRGSTLFERIFSSWQKILSFQSRTLFRKVLVQKSKLEVIEVVSLIDSFPTSGAFCCLLIIFANGLDPNQARQNVARPRDNHTMKSKVLVLENIIPNFIFVA